MSATLLYDRLDERGKDEIEAIDPALCKMAAGTYGICEKCKKLIAPKRLEVTPATRICFRCARIYENRRKTLRKPHELISCAALPDEYRSLSDAELVSLVREHLREDGRIDLNEKVPIIPSQRCRTKSDYVDALMPWKK